MTGSRNPINENYSLHGCVLETATCARYLGVDISCGLSWPSHIDRVTGSETKTLNFVRRNVKIKYPGVREMVYSILVRPQLEYAAALWDPIQKARLNRLRKCSVELRDGFQATMNGWQVYQT